MLKKDGWQKKFLRVKQIADQNLGRAEKSEVLSEDLLVLEKRVDLIKQVCHNTHKKLAACVQGQGTDIEKRAKKMPECMLASSMVESGQLLGTDTLMGKMMMLCGETENGIAANLLQYELDMENKVLLPLHTLTENDIANIHRGRKQLTKMVLDMDSARSRYQSAVKQTQHGSSSITSASSKVENIRDEMEEAAQRVEHCRDQLSTDIYTFVSKEAEHCQLIIDLIQSQADYHRKSLEVLDALLPQLHDQMELANIAPVFGGSLDEHLKRMNRDIALVLEDCICTLLLYGMGEEGLFRIAASASKVKKLRAAFDSGMLDMREFDNDIHCVAGVLKQYLRDLPEPLMTFDLYHEWMAAASLPVDQRLQALWLVLDKLPKNNYNNLRYLIKFLAKLAENQDVNKMSPSNIAIVMGPNVLWSPNSEAGPSMLSTSMQSAIVESLVSHADWFFPEDVDFGVSPMPESSTPPAVDTNSTTGLLDSNQNLNLNHESSSYTTNAIAAAIGPAMILPTVAADTSKQQQQHSRSSSSGRISPPNVMTASTSSLNSSEDRPSGCPPSPKPKRGKKPAPLPPGVPERPPAPGTAPPPVAKKPSLGEDPSSHPHVTISAAIVSDQNKSVDIAAKPPIPDRPGSSSSSGPAPMIPSASSENLYPSLASITTDQKIERSDKPSSPRPERPRAPPPDRPMFPPPEKPSVSEKPQVPSRPDTHPGVGKDRPGTTRPPRPQPPPPPPPDKRNSTENKAPIAEQEPISPVDNTSKVTEATHL